MSTTGDRDNPYSFDDYVGVRDRFDYYADDPFFQALVRHHAVGEASALDEELRDLSGRVSFTHRDLADRAGSLENRIRVTHVKHFDAFNHRVDAVERCPETEQLEREIFDVGLFDPTRNTPWSRFSKMFLLYENGEFGVMCPVACTQGMIALMEKYEAGHDGATEPALGPEARDLLGFVRNGEVRDGERAYGRGAQFITEIQGGSDVAANLVEAVCEDGVWRLYGKKFFCSATQADVALVTAKPTGTTSADRVAVFVVPSWLPQDRERGQRNGYTIDRMKQKLGTAELPTAEITYDGAVAYPVGPLEKGLANVVAVTLTFSRVHVAVGMAAAMLRAAREATWYAQFRQAFGSTVARFPLVANQIADLNLAARRSAAGVFKMYGELLALGERLPAGLGELAQIRDLEERKRRFRLRELIILQKITVAYEAPEMIRLAISLLGGHGIMEDFSALPRLLRDAFIMELWEGPRNVLLAQIHRDLSRVSEWYEPEDFCRDLLGGAGAAAEPLASELGRLARHPGLLSPDPETLQVCRDWDRLSLGLCHAYQDRALAELGHPAGPPSFAELAAGRPDLQ
ncbi:MAG: acyl-CoA dehydrogenase family protein [Acidobacteria bacterium]|nr:acyl-CoA dehydrogenase family protein [Acidobacteriota bacterium]